MTVGAHILLRGTFKILISYTGCEDFERDLKPEIHTSVNVPQTLASRARDRDPKGL